MNYTPFTGDVNPSFEGPLTSKILVVAESPWNTEIAAGRPLCGPSGNKLNYWFHLIGLNRHEMRIENLYPFKPPRIELDSVKMDELLPWINNLHERITNMPNLNLIVTMGNYATFALTGKGKIRAAIRNALNSSDLTSTESERKAGITQLRGSIYEYIDLNGRSIKVMPTIHPAAVTRRAVWEKRCLIDWTNIKTECQFPQIVDVPRNTIIDPTEHDVEIFTKQVENNCEDLKAAVDIECWGKSLSCVGFALTPVESITIPTLTKEQSSTFLPYIKRLCECKVPKILCNGLFDWYWLDAYDIQLVNYRSDVQYAHHALDPIEEHSLNFLSSIYTRFNYWKDEAKDAEEIIKYASKVDALWIYNGYDCCATREIWTAVEKQLIEEGMMEFYQRHYADLLEPLHRMSRHGTRVDVAAQKEWAKQLKIEMKEARNTLEEGADCNLFSTKSKSKFRDPTDAEWDELILEGEVKHDADGIPKPKYINKEVRNTFVENGLTYMMSGKNKGKIRYSVEEDQKGFSKDKLLRFFYGKLGLPKQRKRGTNGKMTVTLDEGAIHKLCEKFPDKIGEYGKILLSYRSREKELQYLSGVQDKDGRVRCSYKFNTKEGRLASSKNPMRTGMNMQNLKR